MIPKSEQQILLCHVLGKSLAYILAHPELTLSSSQQAKYDQLIKKRESGIPIAYLINKKEFWNHDFYIDNNVLIPRPETELLVEKTLQIINDFTKCHIADLGTGSGAIAISLAAERPAWQIHAIDKSANALAVAKKNAKTHKIHNISFYKNNWLDNFDSSIKFAAIVANPPYINQSDPHLQEGDVRFEPKSALIADNNGLQDIEIIAQAAQNHLLPKGFLLIEHGYDQAISVYDIFKKNNYQDIQQFKDLAGIIRVTCGCM